MVVRFILAALLLLMFPAKVNAAFTIENIIPSEISDPNQELTLFVAASNLSSSQQYFQVAITKEGSSNYFGYTQGNSGVWTQYDSSPDFTSLLSFTPTGGTWNGEVKAKIDSADSGFSGPGTYLVKVLKYISSSGTSSNSVPITINIATQIATPTQTPTQAAKEEKKTPTINFSTPGNVKVGEEFEIAFNMSNFESGNYYVKARIGKDSSHLTLGQTFNLSWLGDTDSWSKFPHISGSGKVKSRLSPTAVAGDYKIKLSLKKGDDSPIVSEEKTISFASNPIPSSAPKSSTKTLTPTSTTKISSGIVLATSSSISTTEAMIKEFYKDKDILGTISAAKIQTPKKKPLNLLISNAIEEDFQVGGLSAIGGFVLLCAGAGLFLKKKLSQDE